MTETVTSRPRGGQMRHGTAEPLEEVAISQTIVNEVALHKRSILSRDAMDDSRFNQNMSVVDLSIRSMMCTPLLINGEILGPRAGGYPHHAARVYR